MEVDVSVYSHIQKVGGINMKSCSSSTIFLSWTIFLNYLLYFKVVDAQPCVNHTETRIGEEYEGFETYQQIWDVRLN